MYLSMLGLNLNYVSKRGHWCTDTRIFWYKYQQVNTMATDALAPCITRALIQYKDNILAV